MGTKKGDGGKDGWPLRRSLGTTEGVREGKRRTRFTDFFFFYLILVSNSFIFCFSLQRPTFDRKRSNQFSGISGIHVEGKRLLFLLSVASQSCDRETSVCVVVASERVKGNQIGTTHKHKHKHTNTQTRRKREGVRETITQHMVHQATLPSVFVVLPRMLKCSNARIQ